MTLVKYKKETEGYRESRKSRVGKVPLKKLEKSLDVTYFPMDR